VFASANANGAERTHALRMYFFSGLKHARQAQRVLAPSRDDLRFEVGKESFGTNASQRPGCGRRLGKSLRRETARKIGVRNLGGQVGKSRLNPCLPVFTGTRPPFHTVLESMVLYWRFTPFSRM